MPLEIEYKFLLSQLPPYLKDHEPYIIHQHYNSDKKGLRVRRTFSPDDGYTTPICVQTQKQKTDDKMTRMEHEVEITEDLFHAFFKQSTHSVYKLRYKVDNFDIDLFPLIGLVMAEFEVDAAKRPIIVPHWLSQYIIRDVTYDSQYRNDKIAKMGAELSLSILTPLDDILFEFKTREPVL
jgi:CYTH domain-containing protein